MSGRDAMRRSAAQFLRPGETLQAVFAASAIAPPRHEPSIYAPLFEWAPGERRRIIAVTDQRILMLRSGLLHHRARSVQTVLSRSLRIGPPSGLWHVFDLGPEKLRVARRFFPDIEEADRCLEN